MARFATTDSTVRWLALLGLVFMACIPDSEVAGPPRGPDNLRISRVDSAETFTQPDAATELQLVACEPLMVTIKPYDAENGRLGNFALAQPGGCNGDTNCGWLIVTVTGSRTNSAGEIETFSQETAAVQSPAKVDLPSDLISGELQLSVELRDSNGAPVTREDGKILRAKAAAMVSTTGSCPESPHG